MLPSTITVQARYSGHLPDRVSGDQHLPGRASKLWLSRADAVQLVAAPNGNPVAPPRRPPQPGRRPGSPSGSSSYTSGSSYSTTDSEVSPRRERGAPPPAVPKTQGASLSLAAGCHGASGIDMSRNLSA